jgi:ABC-type branched-subunit amino acid transport system substrate-binding protein
MQPTRAARHLGVALVVFLLSAACGSTVPHATQRALAHDAGLGGPTSAETAGGSAPGSGPVAPIGGGPAMVPGNGRPGLSPSRTPATVSRDAAWVTTPLKVGLTYIDNGTATPALGASASNTVDGRTAAQALVRGINAAGGIKGRMLQTVEYSWNTSHTNYDADATTACQLFSTDNHVEVVIDTAFGTTGGFGACLQKAGVLQITNGTEGDRTSSQRAALHANTRSMVHERTYAAVLTNLVATRYLSNSNQLGIIREQCPAIESAYNRAIVPLIAKLGLKAPAEATIQCTSGFDSAGPAAAAISNAILAFRQHQVDRVMFVSDYESVVVLLFGNNASSQQYRPGYALSSNAQAALATANIPSDQWPQLHGVGNVPTSDVADTGAPPSPVDARCLQLAKAGGLAMANAADNGFAFGACAPFLLLEAALGRTRGNSAPLTLQSAVNGLGASFAAPGVVGNSARFSSTEHDGPNAVQVFAYAAGCSCTRYSGAPLPAPT